MDKLLLGLLIVKISQQELLDLDPPVGLLYALREALIIDLHGLDSLV